ncbi:MAG: hypothetical protein ACUVXI_06775 [bacterium]
MEAKAPGEVDVYPTGATNIGDIEGFESLFYTPVEIEVPEEANPKENEAIGIETAKLKITVTNNTDKYGDGSFGVSVKVNFYVSSVSGDYKDRGDPIPLNDPETGKPAVLDPGESLPLETDNIPALVEGVKNGKFWIGYEAPIDVETSANQEAPEELVTGLITGVPPDIDWKLHFSDIAVVIDGELKPLGTIGCSATP